MAVWLWQTPHFTAKVSSTQGAFLWSITYRADGVERTLVDDIAKSFADAENQVREYVGKSYPRELGYLPYAGPLANTFRVNSGETYDFTPQLGKEVTLHYRTRNDQKNINEDYSVTGLLSVQHYDIVVRTKDGGGLKIPPSSVIRLFDAMMREIPLTAVVIYQKDAKSRTVVGWCIPGCTGEPGQQKGTVDHPPTSPWCPIHED